MLGEDSTFSLNRDQLGREVWPPLQWQDQQTGPKDVALIAAFQTRFGQISNAEAVRMLPLPLAQSLVVITEHTEKLVKYSKSMWARLANPTSPVLSLQPPFPYTRLFENRDPAF